MEETRLNKKQHKLSTIDAVVTHKFWGLIIFLTIILGVFSIIFGSFGNSMRNSISWLFNDVIKNELSQFLNSSNSPEWVHALLVNTVATSIGSVLAFLPQIAFLFLFLTILQMSGYMARAAVVLNKTIGKIGLPGESFVPMLMGFGCTTPAVITTRFIENPRDRRLTIMIIPFISCGARLPIYLVFTSAFFKSSQTLVVFAMYLLGVVVALTVGVILKRTVMKTVESPMSIKEFIQKQDQPLPPWKFPSLFKLTKSVLKECLEFLNKVGTVIFSMSIIIWILQNFTFSFEPTIISSNSILGVIGRFIAPFLLPLGFGTWQAAVSLIAGLVAKEAVVSTLAITYSIGDIGTGGLSTALQDIFTPLSSISFMVFTLLYVPCVSAFFTIKRELGSLKSALKAASLQLCVAYFVSMIIYQMGHLFFK